MPAQQAAKSKTNARFEALRSDNDVFSGTAPNPQADPLANHVVQDPGFVPVDPTRNMLRKLNRKVNTNSIHYNPALLDVLDPIPDGSLNQSGARTKNKIWWPSYLAMALIGITLPVGGVAFFLMPLYRTFDFDFGPIRCFGACSGAFAEIWTLVLIHREDNRKFVMAFLFAPVRWGFLFNNWNRHKDVGTLMLISVRRRVFGRRFADPTDHVYGCR